MTLSLEILEGTSAFERLQPEWSALVDLAGGPASVFLQPEWHLAWLDAHSDLRPTLIIARSQGRLAGVLPLVRIRRDWVAVRVAPTGVDTSDLLPPLVEPALASVVVPALFDAAFQRFGKWVVYWWRGLPSEDASLDLLREHFRERGLVWFEEREPSPRFRLVGSTYEEAERAWSKSHRQDVRRQRKRLADLGPISLWQPSSLPEASETLEVFFDVHDEKWLSQGFPGKFQNPAVREHFRSILRRLWGRGLHFSTLRCGSKHLSYHLGFLSGGWLLWYRPAYRLEAAQYSPGKVHIALLVEEAYRLGWKGVDFLLGDEKYKFAWSNEQTDVVHLNVSRYSRLPTYVWYRSARPLIRSRVLNLYRRSKAWLERRRLQPDPEIPGAGK